MTGSGAASASTDRRILRAASVVAFSTVAVRVLGLVKEPIVAATFGATGQMDAFLIAFLLPTYFVNVTSSAFTSSFVPAYLRTVADEGESAGEAFLRGALFLSLAFLTVGVLVLAALAPVLLPWIGSELAPEELALAQRLVLVLLPTLVIKGASTVFASILNSRERFLTAALVPGAIPLCVLAALFAKGDELGVAALAWGTLAGYAAEAVLLAVALTKRGLPILPRWRTPDPRMRAAIGQYLPLLAGASIVSAAMLVDQAMAAWLGPGSVSSLHYGQKLTAVLAGISATALGTAILPAFSRLVAERRRDELRRTLGTWVRWTLAATLPATALLYAIARPVVALLYERGAFGPRETEVVSGVMAMYVLYVPSFLVGTVLNRFLSAVGRNRVMMEACLLSLPLNVGLNWVLMNRMGVSGIALSTSLVYLVTMSYCGVAAYRAQRVAAAE